MSHEGVRHDYDSDGIAYWTYGRRGSGRCALLCHGLTSSHLSWEPVARRLADKGWFCVSWDSPLHGASRRDGGYSFATCADDLSAILGIEGVTSCVACGHSLGCYVIQALGALRPGLVSGALMLDGTPFGYHLTPVERWSLLHYDSIAKLLPWGYYVRSAASGSCETAEAAESFTAELEGLGRRGMLAASHDCYAAVVDAPATLALPRSIPAVLGIGKHDKLGVVAPAMAAWAADLGVELHVIKGAGHNTVTDAPDEVTGLVELAGGCRDSI
ncbi:MAG: alpha/beta hydrolase [Atopobiaceae bacterium]|jgi:pimeloyl-ACP methyl ester carboxylesterase|nr:alpha/beta hydrolase [Atopobiaceae bacterium]